MQCDALILWASLTSAEPHSRHRNREETTGAAPVVFFAVLKKYCTAVLAVVLFSRHRRRWCRRGPRRSYTVPRYCMKYDRGVSILKRFMLAAYSFHSKKRKCGTSLSVKKTQASCVSDERARMYAQLSSMQWQQAQHARQYSEHARIRDAFCADRRRLKHGEPRSFA